MKTLEEKKKEFSNIFGSAITYYDKKGKPKPIMLRHLSVNYVWPWIESTISQTKHEEKKIDHDIDVRYEKNLEVAFDKFVEKWCGNYSAHLSDCDENDGEFIRMKIRKLQRKAKSASQTKQELIEEIKVKERQRIKKIFRKIEKEQIAQFGDYIHIPLSAYKQILQKLSNK